jgi:hypothetical protein
MDQGFLGSSAILACVMWPSTPAERRRLAIAAPHVWPSTVSASAISMIMLAQSHTHWLCGVRFGRAVTGRTRDTRYEARLATPSSRPLPAGSR